MYPKHHTRAIILRTYPLKEADKGFVLFTEKFGVLHAKAIGLRKETSKLRYKLSGHILVSLTVIQGKSGWRIVEVSNCAPLSSNIGLQALGKILKLILYISPKEDPMVSVEIFDDVYNYILNKDFDSTEKTLRLAVKIMKSLGYVPNMDLSGMTSENMITLLDTAIKNSDLSKGVRFKW